MSGSRSRDSSAIAQEWLNRALDDLRVARHTLTLKPDCPYAIVCFHAQQAVEKSLKAILTRLGRQFPKTHDLTELVPLLPDSLREQLTEIEFNRLNPYAVEARYPGDLEPVTRQEALAALRGHVP